MEILMVVQIRPALEIDVETTKIQDGEIQHRIDKGKIHEHIL